MNDETNHDNEFEDDIEWVSKTQVKKEMLALQELGIAISELNAEQQAKIPMDDKLRLAIEETRRITHKNARKRHMQYIGKLMRASDVDAIQEAFDKLQSDAVRLTRHHHQIEQWRDNLLDPNQPDAVGKFIEQYPQVDRQQINQLVRSAQKEASQNKPPASARKLFKFIRETVAEHL
ncbi:hypothetical protein TDB9533_02805 [Thalassocella blandensis]|nr:hypothetical protein TDB9533_02805 [Thalassocella blandensis]